MNVRIFGSTSVLAYGKWRGVFLYAFRGTLSVAELEPTVACAYSPPPPGDPFLYFGFVEQSATEPSEEVRRWLAKGMERAPGLVASATVFDGTGFRAAMVRFAVTAISMLSRAKNPHRAFANGPDGARFLVKYLANFGSSAYGEAELVEALETVRNAPVQLRVAASSVGARAGHQMPRKGLPDGSL